ncbi:unnamed protein product [Cylicocyclus nassatus]|uniref:Uncharacterized protein n=1 Tax=Cylicocyclus nassatus TaxID=53992 RepID=A0AA36M9F3_CYLNA|nr:unnamed protein product [Cylicocyclus nassatus]
MFLINAPAASKYSEQINIDVTEKEDPLYANYKSIFHQNARDGDVKAIEELLNKCPKLVGAYDCDKTPPGSKHCYVGKLSVKRPSL